jgi:hypothetical protein
VYLVITSGSDSGKLPFAALKDEDRYVSLDDDTARLFCWCNETYGEEKKL